MLHQDSTEPAPSIPVISRSTQGSRQEFRWRWKKRPVKATYEVIGTGRQILLLPALSSVSSREEMRGLALLLAEEFQVFLLDWVGFGQSDRPALRYRPAVYHAFLRDFVKAVFSEPVVVIAAGHSAGYVMELATRSHGDAKPWSWVVLVAPTWRGPLPTAMGESHRWFYSVLRWLVRSPLLGQILYLLNTAPAFLRWMYRRHVFADPANVTKGLIGQKWRTTQRRGGRFASAAFVTGALDPVRSRSKFFEYFQPLPVPVLMVIGEQTPPKSLAEMEVLAHFSGVQVHRMPGALGLHEESPDRLFAGISTFLRKYLSR